MRTENNKSKLMPRLIKSGVFVGVSCVVMYFGLLYVFGVRNLDPDYYGSYFYVWRVKHADKIMTHGRYKLIKTNEHPDTPERRDFYKFAQEGPSYLIVFDRPEHFPREFAYQFSLMFDEYEDFLRMRQNYIVGTEDAGDKVSFEHSELLEEVKNRKESDAQFFRDASGKSVSEIMSLMFPAGRSEKNAWFGVSESLMSLIVKILSGNKEYYFDGHHASSKLKSDIIEGMSGLSVSRDITGEQIDKFFVDNGRVSVSPVGTFAYSRLYYVFYFLTAGMPLHGSGVDNGSRPGTEASVKEVQKFNEARMMYTAHMFARIFSQLYPYRHMKDTSEVGIWKKLRNSFSPHGRLDSDPVDSRDLELVREEFSSYLSSRVSSGG